MRPFAVQRHLGTRRARGVALLVVLLVLIALLVLSAPFLLMARNADRASGELADRAEARIALDTAGRHARVLLGRSHSGFDGTPYFDSLEEIAVDNRFDPAFLDPNDEGGLMWDLERADVAGSIDLNSAPPQVIANLMAACTRVSRAVKSDDKEIPLAATTGLEASGVLWLNGELLRYSTIAEGALVEPVRGLLGPSNPAEWRGGPLPPSGHGAGDPVIDQRAFAPALWRVASGDGEVRAFDSKERVRESGVYALAAALAAKESTAPGETRAAREIGLSEDALRPLFLYGSVHGGVRGGHVWQRPGRVSDRIEGGKDGIVAVENARWLNPGSTVRITDGTSTELALVQSIRRNGERTELVLDRILQNDYEAWETIVSVLARRPVNLNTAPPPVLEALFWNLQVAGRNSRITRDEAQKLADLVLESRPFIGFEDFLRRVVLPAAGIEKLPGDAPVVPAALASVSGSGGFIDPEDAQALYMNGLNANDGALLYSTMPFSFVTRDTYDVELRATVGAPSGVERFSLVRKETDLVVPQRELLALWARQEDFDEALRLDLEAPWWMTAPSATSRWDSGSVPPSRLWAHLGTAEGQPYLPGVTDPSAFKDRESPPSAEHVYASREDTAWVQLWPSRVAGKPNVDGRVIHFDHETRDPEGRYLPDQIVSRSTDDTQVKWTDPAALLLRPLSFSLWVKPKAVADSYFLDVGGTSRDADRLSLRLDTQRGDLVLQVISAGGNHPDTAEIEYGEARFAIAQSGTSPGLPIDIWSHVEVDVRGNRPDQINMLVNGLAHGVRTPGLTRLAGGIALTDAVLPVESVEGFPPRCAVRVGNEVIEVEITGGQMRAALQTIGTFAGCGGRLAREEYGTLSYPGSSNLDVPARLGGIAVAHPAGTPVQLYGYSLPLTSDLPTGRSELPNDLGPFRVAEFISAEGGTEPIGDRLFVGFVDCGTGMDGAVSEVTALRLASADDPSRPAAEYMPAFNATGGYAAIVQYNFTVTDSDTNQEGVRTTTGALLGGIEIVRYASVDNDRLVLAQRGIGATELPNLGSLTTSQAPLMGQQPRAFVAQWNPNLYWINTGQRIRDDLFARVYVFPISLPVPGTSSTNAFLAGSTAAQESRFAQITHTNDAEFTEWVRYDWFQMQFGQLVRDDPNVLERVYRVIVGQLTGGARGDGSGPGDGGGGTGPGGTGGMAASAPSNSFIAASQPPPPASAPSPEPRAQSYSSQWDPRLGQSDNPRAQFPLTEAVATHFQFRGVLGTYTHQHPRGTPVLPVFTVSQTDVNGGRPGRLDAAFLFGSGPNHIGWPVRVHRAHIPSAAVGVTDWTQTAPAGLPEPSPPSAANALEVQDNFILNEVYVALDDRSPEIMVADTINPATPQPDDPRIRTRLTCFPSGERPRAVGRMVVGGGFDGPSSGAVPAAVVDEIVFGDGQFARGSPLNDEALAGSSAFLVAGVDGQGLHLQVADKAVVMANGAYNAAYEFLNDMPQDAGLLRIGEEIVCYNQRDPATGNIDLAPNGRGLLGTRAQPHQLAELVSWLEGHPVSFLAGAIGAGDATIPIADLADFPPNGGTVLIGEELIHYTRIQAGALAMPRASAVAGRMDEKGNGLFRGRYGTTPAGHAMGEPVILFPFRYWDRWQEKADAPELAYFGLSIDQPSAFFGSCFFFKEDVDSCQLGVLQRTDPAAPWDADPEEDTRLKLYWQGDAEGQPLAIGKQSDRMEWRVFAKYSAGAFDVTTGFPHGWKQTPRLNRFGAFYFGPGAVLASVER